MQSARRCARGAKEHRSVADGVPLPQRPARGPSTSRARVRPAPAPRWQGAHARRATRRSGPSDAVASFPADADGAPPGLPTPSRRRARAASAACDTPRRSGTAAAGGDGRARPRATPRARLRSAGGRTGDARAAEPAPRRHLASMATASERRAAPVTSTAACAPGRARRRGPESSRRRIARQGAPRFVGLPASPGATSALMTAPPRSSSATSTRARAPTPARSSPSVGAAPSSSSSTRSGLRRQRHRARKPTQSPGSAPPIRSVLATYCPRLPTAGARPSGHRAPDAPRRGAMPPAADHRDRARGRAAPRTPLRPARSPRARKGDASSARARGRLRPTSARPCAQVRPPHVCSRAGTSAPGVRTRRGAHAGAETESVREFSECSCEASAAGLIRSPVRPAREW